jgi:hypothetical protein
MSAANSIKSWRGGHGARLPPESIRGLGVEERRLVEAALVRKIDLRLMPMLILMYIMNYLDRNNIAAGG